MWNVAPYQSSLRGEPHDETGRWKRAAAIVRVRPRTLAAHYRFQAVAVRSMVGSVKADSERGPTDRQGEVVCALARNESVGPRFQLPVPEADQHRPAGWDEVDPLVREVADEIPVDQIVDLDDTKYQHLKGKFLHG